MRFHVEGIFELQDPDVAVACHDLPIEPEPIQTAEDVAFNIVGPDLQVKRVASADLPETRGNFDPVYPCHLDLGGQHRSRTCRKILVDKKYSIM